jgi:serine/threonine protein kinase
MAACPECGTDCPEGAVACPNCKHKLGRSLHEELAAGTPTLARTLELASSIASMMVKMHEAKVVHVYLTPRHIYLLKRQGQPDLVKLLSATKAPPEGASRDWTAPEDTSGRTPDVRSNIYTYGVILHEMATGSRPVAGQTPRQTAKAKGIAHEVPKALEDLIVHCTKKSPTDRPETMAEVEPRIDAIRVAFKSGVLEKPPEPEEKKSGAGRWILVLVVLALLGGGGYVGWTRLNPPPPPPPPPDMTAPPDLLQPPAPDLAAPPDMTQLPDLAPAAKSAKPKGKTSKPGKPADDAKPAAPAAPAFDPFAPKK